MFNFISGLTVGSGLLLIWHMLRPTLAQVRGQTLVDVTGYGPFSDLTRWGERTLDDYGTVIYGKERDA